MYILLGCDTEKNQSSAALTTEKSGNNNKSQHQYCHW